MPTATYEPIATQTLGSAQSSVTFNSFSGYTDLVLVASARSAYTTDASDGLRLRLNSDSGTNYSWTNLGGNVSNAFSGRASSVNIGEIGSLATSSSSNTAFGVCIANFQNYANTTTYKTIISRSGEARLVNYGYTTLWRSTSAITEIVLSSARASNFVAGSTFTLYGIKAA